MSILNRTSDGLLTVLIALRKTLLAYGPLTRGALLARCAPPSLTHYSNAFDNQTQARQTLSRWMQLGLFIEDSQERIALADGFVGPADDLDAFRSAVRALVLRSSAAPDGTLDLDAPAADFVQALCWVLSQDVYRLPGGPWREVEPIETAQLASEPYIVQNQTRWDGFRDWAPFLGFGWSVRRGRTTLFFADPTEAVRSSLNYVFGEDPVLPIEVALARVRDALPVSDGGSFRVAVESRLGGSWVAPDPRDISPSLTRALLGLELAGDIVLDDRADADQRNLLGRNRRLVRHVSHVVRT